MALVMRAYVVQSECGPDKKGFYSEIILPVPYIQSEEWLQPLVRYILFRIDEIKPL